MHWQRWRRHGDPLVVLPPSAGPQPLPIDRFWSKVDTSDADGCWPWTGGRDRDGYGHFKVDGRMWRAPRWIFEQVHGPLPADRVVRHACDDPPCVRPDHLLAGYAVDNTADAVERHRLITGDDHHMRRDPEALRRGEQNTAARLTDSQVVEIRRRYAAGETQVSLAGQFGVSQGAVSSIIRRVTWTHLE